MSPSATASLTFDEATMARGWYWHCFKNPWLFWRFPLIGVGFIGASIFIFTQGGDKIATPWALLITGIYFTLRYWIIRIRFHRDIRKNPQYGKKFRWIFSEEKLYAETEGLELKSDWNKFHEAYITPDGFLLYPQKGIFYWIPKSGFETTEAALFVEITLRQKTNAKKLSWTTCQK